MPKRLSSILKVTHKELDEKGVFDAFVDIDSKLYIDPCLLELSRIREFNDAHESFKNYFQEVLILIRHSKVKNDLFWKKAKRKLQFKEFKYIALGYSQTNTTGNAIGATLAEKLLDTATQIVSAGITDPIIFELVGLFEEGIGADRISDMTAHIIKNKLIDFTKRVSAELNIPTKMFSALNAQVPFNPKTNQPIVFVPKDLLSDLPMALSWEDIDQVNITNSDLRNRVNNEIGRSWKQVTHKLTKSGLKGLLLEYPEILKNLIGDYKQKPKSPYNFNTDPSGQVIWAELSERAVKEFPMRLAAPASNNSSDIFKTVLSICEQFAKLVENNGWYEFLYNDTGKLRHERFAQKLFYGIADSYCEANNLNLSREPNAGSGALDFKISGAQELLLQTSFKKASCCTCNRVNLSRLGLGA